jgi:hypothetical protein
MTKTAIGTPFTEQEYEPNPTIKTIPEVNHLFKHGGRFECYWSVDENYFTMAESWIYNEYYLDWAAWLHSVRLTDASRDASDFANHTNYERKVKDGEWDAP